MRKSIGIALGLILFLSRPSSTVLAQCNGDPALCSRRFDEVCYATTHNAFNYQGDFLFPNQSFDVARQLQDGIRGLMLDVYWYNSRPTVYHSSNFLGNQPLSDLLDDIKAFLDSQPNEVVSIIFESYITAAQMNAAFTQAGLLPYVHAQPQGSPWPTLGDMIAANRRLVVFTDVNDGQAYPWYHYVWDHAVETHYSANSRSDFSCAYNRGDSTKSLFILNHFITQQSLGYGLIDSAAAVNANPYLTDRAMGCWAATGKRPNFLTVDFYEQGDVMAAKDALNVGALEA
ncbi:MAG TPA: phosphatidylinositol-specific phospholipase C domain-containing protein, partial [Bacteroidia bacterium]|nr:phosphatidylinositol-specific phospholipase C domain-containing protein [Bacteroidia bacterium]